MTQRDDKPIVPWGLMYAGLIIAAVGQLALIVAWATGDLKIAVPPVGNFVALVVVIGAVWLIRARQKGRL